MNHAEPTLSIWDVFHSSRLELERGLSAASIRSALESGLVEEDDLVRPAGTTNPWIRVGDVAELMAPPSVPATPITERVPPATAGPEVAGTTHRLATDFEVGIDESLTAPSAAIPTTVPFEPVAEGSEPDDVTFPVVREEPLSFLSNVARQTATPAREPEPPPWIWDDDDDDGDSSEGLEILDDDSSDAVESIQSPSVIMKLEGSSQASLSALPVVGSRDREAFGQEPLEDEEQFTLSRSGPLTVEELDLAPMVDVALQLVLFFMVTATTVLYKSLEIPKPSVEPPPAAVTQGRSRSLDDLKDDFILVEIDSGNAVKIDREPAPADRAALIDRLTRAREKTGRKAMLLSTDYRTLHRYAVMACDAANEIGLQIKVANPAPPQPTKGPGLLASPASPPSSG